MRALLQSDLSNDACLASGSQDAGTVPLRIGGLVAILAASAVGVYLPLASSWSRMQMVFLFGQAFAGEGLGAYRARSRILKALVLGVLAVFALSVPHSGAQIPFW